MECKLRFSLTRCTSNGPWNTMWNLICSPYTNIILRKSLVFHFKEKKKYMERLFRNKKKDKIMTLIKKRQNQNKAELLVLPAWERLLQTERWFQDNLKTHNLNISLHHFLVHSVFPMALSLFKLNYRSCSVKESTD